MNWIYKLFCDCGISYLINKNKPSYYGVWLIGEDNSDIGNNDMRCHCGNILGRTDWGVIGNATTIHR